MIDNSVNGKSTWASELIALLHKEALVDLRSKHGVYTIALFALVIVTTIALSVVKETLRPSLAAGMLWISLLFSSVTAIARSFISEEESGTADLLRLVARPEIIYWAKLLYNAFISCAIGLLILLFFLLFTRVEVADATLFLCTVFVGCLALASGMTLTSVWSSRARGRHAIMGVISIPPLLWMLAPGIAATRIALGAPASGGWHSVLAMLSLTIAYLAIGPFLFSTTWKE